MLTLNPISPTHFTTRMGRGARPSCLQRHACKRERETAARRLTLISHEKKNTKSALFPEDDLQTSVGRSKG